MAKESLCTSNVVISSVQYPCCVSVCACVAGSKNVQEFSAAEVREIDPNVNEAIVSSIHTMKWCPTVAYSSCSARVFTKV